jgi:hypothetical protein
VTENAGYEQGGAIQLAIEGFRLPILRRIQESAHSLDHEAEHDVRDVISEFRQPITSKFR